jgi:hypothetical protein
MGLGMLRNLRIRNKVASAAALAVMVSAFVFIAAACGGRPSARGPSISAAAIDKIRHIARLIAYANRDPVPTCVEVVATSARKIIAPAAAGGSYNVPNGESVFVISMTGHFLGYGFSFPTRASLPKGTVLSIVINAKTFHVMAEGLNNKSIDLAALGRPFRISWK